MTEKESQASEEIEIPDLEFDDGDDFFDGDDNEENSEEMTDARKKRLMTDSIAKYFNDISGFDVLSREEEKRLFIEMHGDDKEKADAAREKLILYNLKLVASIAKHFRTSSMKPEDLLQEGTIGLMRAIEKYDVSKGFKLSTYATWWIRQSIARAVADKELAIRMPVKFYEEAYAIGKAEHDLSAEKRRMPTRREIAVYLLNREGIESPTEEQVKKKLQRMTDSYRNRNMVSLNAPAGSDDSGTEVIDFVTTGECEPKTTAVKDALADEIHEIMLSLNPREEFIIRARYGMPNTNGLYNNYEIKGKMTLDEIADVVGVTRERVRQIEIKTIKSMQSTSNKKRLRPFLY